MGFITVADSKLHYNDFKNLMSDTVKALQNDSQNKKSYYCERGGLKLEDDVLKWMKESARQNNFDPKLICKTEPQHFPDIISNNYFGVEVKSTKSNTWKSTGSSIIETLRTKDVQKVFMLFGKLSKEEIDFRCKPYEECLYEIAVTHSPRYLIDMELDNNSTIFNKLNTSYDEFRLLGEKKQIDKVREYYRTEKYKAKDSKSMPWWIGDTIEQQFDTNNFELMLSSDLKRNSKIELISRCYAIFPEILGKKQDKFRRPSLWMCSRHSVICTNIRDFFSAGGKGDIYVDGEKKWSNVPKVICNLLCHIQKIKELFGHNKIEEDVRYFAMFPHKAKADFIDWKNAANDFLKETLGCTNSTLTIDELIEYEFDEATTNAHKGEFHLRKK